MKKILVVEDNVKFQAAAKKFFGKQKGVDVVYAQDYLEAITALENQEFSGVITDIFFPAKTGSNDIALGQEALKKMKETLSKDQEAIAHRFSEVERMFSHVVEINERVRKVLQADLIMAYLLNKNEFDSSYRSGLRSALARQGKAKATAIVEIMMSDEEIENAENEIFDSGLERHYQAIENKMAKSENEQPLGMFVAEKAKAMGIPFVMATSTFHHGEGTHAVHIHVLRKDWPKIVDSNDTKAKASKEFWAQAFAALKRRG